MKVDGIVTGYVKVKASADGKWPAKLNVAIANGDVMFVGQCAKDGEFGKIGSAVVVEAVPREKTINCFSITVA